MTSGGSVASNAEFSAKQLWASSLFACNLITNCLFSFVACMRACLHVHVCLCTCMYVYARYVCVCTCVRAHMYACTYVQVCECVRM